MWQGVASRWSREPRRCAPQADGPVGHRAPRPRATGTRTRARAAGATRAGSHVLHGLSPPPFPQLRPRQLRRPPSMPTHTPSSKLTSGSKPSTHGRSRRKCRGAQRKFLFIRFAPCVSIFKKRRWAFIGPHPIQQPCCADRHRCFSVVHPLVGARRVVAPRWGDQPGVWRCPSAHGSRLQLAGHAGPALCPAPARPCSAQQRVRGQRERRHPGRGWWCHGPAPCGGTSHGQRFAGFDFTALPNSACHVQRAALPPLVSPTLSLAHPAAGA